MLGWHPEPGTHGLDIVAEDQRFVRARFVVAGEAYEVSHEIVDWEPHRWHHVRVEFLRTTVQLHVDGLMVAGLDDVPLNVLAAMEARVTMGASGTELGLEGVVDELVVR